MKIKCCVFSILALLGLSLCVNLFWFYAPQKFSIQHFQPHFAHEAAWDVPSANLSQIQAILKQRFTYLGHGKQAMVFASADHAYVLKLFYYQRPVRKHWWKRPENWLRYSSPSWIYKIALRHAKLKKLFHSTHLAFSEMRAESGLVFVHLNTTQVLSENVTLLDRHGHTHCVDLNATPFVLQHKAELLPAHLKRLIRAGDFASAQQTLEKLRSFFAWRTQQGISDACQQFKNNYGILQGEIVQLDTGKILKYPELDPLEERRKIHQRLEHWVKKYFPELIAD